jgi:hypothetical protein
VPLLPGLEQKVASAANWLVPALGWRWSWKA